MQEFFDEIFYENEVRDFMFFIAWIVFGFVFQQFISKVLNRLLFQAIKKYSSGVDLEKFYELLNRPIGFFLLLVIFYIAFSYLDFPASWHLAPPEEFGVKMVGIRAYSIVLIFSFTWIFLRLIDFLGLILEKKAIETETKQDDQLVPFIVEIGKIILVVLSFFVILGSVFKLNITSLVAGLGIGGLAVALAAKESLENLFGSFTIFFDKPFVVGDMVQVGNIIGTVEKVGFRSTRIRTLEKSFLTVPNKKMIDAELDNLTLRTFRRARFNIGLVYQTTEEQMRNIVADIQKYIDDHHHTNQDGKVRFVAFSDSALEIMIQYFVDTMDWDVYLKVKEEINFKIMEIVKKHNTSFAFPSRTLYIQSENLNNQ